MIDATRLPTDSILPGTAPTSRTPRLDVVCRGDPYEMGFSQGSTMQAEIQGTLRSLPRLEAFRLAKPAWLPFSAFRRAAEGRIDRFWSALETACPEMNRKLDGLAAGSKVRRRSLRLLNALEPFMANLRGKAVVPPPGSCSAIAMRGRRFATGEPVLARNFDNLPLVQPFYVLRESHPSEGCRSLDFTIAALGGTVDGINEHGLAIAYSRSAKIACSPAVRRRVFAASECTIRLGPAIVVSPTFWRQETASIKRSCGRFLPTMVRTTTPETRPSAPTAPTGSRRRPCSSIRVDV